ncbi:MAG TPA: hypothetical protein VHP11_05005, partial [Tepidisphaeraceae bacterium]|nr:hypothetical protein [Tepidisphaeraceae bacterium]
SLRSRTCGKADTVESRSVSTDTEAGEIDVEPRPVTAVSRQSRNTERSSVIALLSGTLRWYEIKRGTFPPRVV